MPRGNHRHMGVALDEAHQLLPLPQAQEENLAGLAGREQPRGPVSLVPGDQPLQGRIINIPIRREGCDHNRPQAVIPLLIHSLYPPHGTNMYAV